MCLGGVHDFVLHVEAVTTHRTVRGQARLVQGRVAGGPSWMSAVPAVDPQQHAPKAPSDGYLPRHPPATTVWDEFIVSTVVSSVTPESWGVAIQQVSGLFGCHVLTFSPDNFHWSASRVQKPSQIELPPQLHGSEFRST